MQKHIAKLKEKHGGKRPLLIAVAAIIIVAIAVIAAGQLFYKPAPAQGNLADSGAVLLSINFGNATGATIAHAANGTASFYYAGGRGANLPASHTVLSLLQYAASTSNFTVVTKDYPQLDSVMVASIANVTNGDGGNYWTYYLDGKLAPIGASQETYRSGDVIEWKFQPSPFG